ncbi:hypothetical protein M4Z12_03135, partial [Pseudomonas sp. In614]|uniref:hypothetical protein n=1 Tax=Pseudomonas nunensis TaxID=2961896 RepID=UPI0020C11C68
LIQLFYQEPAKAPKTAPIPSIKKRFYIEGIRNLSKADAETHPDPISPQDAIGFQKENSD